MGGIVYPIFAVLSRTYPECRIRLDDGSRSPFVFSREAAWGEHSAQSAQRDLNGIIERGKRMKTLLTGGTGTVGSNVVIGLAAKGRTVRVLTRDKGRANHLPAAIEVAVGDLNDPESARAAFAGIDAVFLLNGVTQTEAYEGLVAVALATAAKAKRLVYMSVQGAHSAPHLPHFGSKIGVEAAVKASGIPYSLVEGRAP